MFLCLTTRTATIWADLLHYLFLKIFLFFLFTMTFYFIYFFVLLGPQPWHMEVPRLGVELELQLPAYARATGTPDSSRVCDLHHSS